MVEYTLAMAILASAFAEVTLAFTFAVVTPASAFVVVTPASAFDMVASESSVMVALASVVVALTPNRPFVVNLASSID